jgi:DNA-binding MarR family transcriptional regulator
MNELDLLTQTQHVSDIFTRVMLKILTIGALSGDCEITMAQYQALKHVEHHGSCTIGSLAEGLGVTQPAATMLVDRMVKRGLVDREPGRTDRRQAEVSLTGRARELLHRAEEERAERLSRVLSLMEPAEREQLLESLERFVAAAVELETPVEGACLRCGIEHDNDCVVNKAHIKLRGTEVTRT